jgi:hypothetical protein
MSFRKEKKFKLSSYDLKKLKSELIQSGMTSLYPARIITSQYFDTNDYKMFDESEEGILPRKKVRVRYYNNLKEKLSFEEKTSSIEGRYKKSKIILENEYNKMLRGFLHKDYGMIYPSAIVSYQREYFSFRNTRITFDQNIKYQFYKKLTTLNDFDCVVEIKVPFGCPDDFIEKIFPIPTSRFSKYARAFTLRI